MSWLDTSDVDTLPGLLPGNYRGVPFHVLDASQDVGRRVILTWFPGLDWPSSDDQGAFDGPMRLVVFIIGDDYIIQAEAMRAALEMSGPATLVHPFLGFRLVQPAAPARISFATAQLKVARVELYLQPVWEIVTAIASTLSGLLGSATTVLSAVASLVTAIGSDTQTVSSWSSGTSAATAAALIGTTACGAIGIGLDDSAIVAAASSSAGADTAAALGTAISALPAPMTTAALTTPSPVAVAAGAVAAEPVDARTTLATALTMAEDTRALAGAGTLAAAVRVASAAATLATAAQIGTAVSWESRDEAAAWRVAIDDALGAVAADLEALAGTLTGSAGAAAAAWTAIADLRAAIGRDMHEVVGRLPPVIRYTPPRPLSVWLIVHHFAGDDLATVAPMVADIRRRNRLPHPARTGADGPIEILAS